MHAKVEDDAMKIHPALMNSGTAFFRFGVSGWGSECRSLLKIYKQDTLPVKCDAAGGGSVREGGNGVFDSSK